MPNPAQHNVMIVDDMAPNLDVLSRLLAEHRTLRAANAAEAYTLLEEGANPDLILLDIMMPGETGFDLCRRLKADERFRDIPVVFMTGVNNPDDESKGLQLGAVDYITKPFNPSVVRARVRTHLSLRLATATLAEHTRILEEQVAQRTAQLSAALRQINDASHETIVRLCRAAEYKDEDTGVHVVRMSQYAAVIARQLGIHERSIEVLQGAAPMHDIGKIGIPERILLKRGPLDAIEWEVMKNHTELGARILAGSKSEVIRLGEVLALTHHERWDGAGYPRGLKGSDIPLPGRILAVADMFDALVSKRPYKEPISIDASFEMIREHRGTAFDPHVVDAFIDKRSEIIEIKARYEDTSASPLFGEAHRA